MPSRSRILPPREFAKRAAARDTPAGRVISADAMRRLIRLRGQRLARRAELAREKIAAVKPKTKVFSRLFTRVMQYKEQPSVALAKILQERAVSPETRAELQEKAKELDRRWTDTRALEGEILSDPAGFFKRFFGFQPANNGIEARSFGIGIHLGLSPENYSLLLEKGKAPKDSGGYFDANSLRKPIFSFSRMLEYQDMPGKLYTDWETVKHETWHNWTHVLFNGAGKAGMAKKAEKMIRSEISAFVLEGAKASDLDYHLKTYLEKTIPDKTAGSLKQLMDEASRLYRETVRQIEKGDFPPGLSEEEALSFLEKRQSEFFSKMDALQRQIERMETDARERARAAFEIVERTVSNPRFVRILAEAQKLLPREELATYIEQCSLPQLPTILDRLISERKKHKDSRKFKKEKKLFMKQLDRTFRKGKADLEKMIQEVEQSQNAQR
ncbi:MAG: hypothetical protein NT067_01820 [Candidatus Diapherotrites archaeon]|nr:hypothetical protein [Candidatus Diapherotrites archaeon]